MESTPTPSPETTDAPAVDTSTPPDTTASAAPMTDPAEIASALVHAPATPRPPRPKHTKPPKPNQGRPHTKVSPPSSQGDFHPGYVNYGAVVSMLLKASRYRRNQLQRSRSEPPTTGEVRAFYSVSFGGPPQSGKTRFLVERFEREWSTSLLVVVDDKARRRVSTFLSSQLSSSPLMKEFLKRVVTVEDIYDVLNTYHEDASVNRPRPILTIEVDPEDHNPAATVASYMEDYLRLQREHKEGGLPSNHPLILPLKTVYVDGMVTCEGRNLTFQRLVRFLRLGGQLPEIIISQ